MTAPLPAGQISPHFARQEFACKCGCGFSAIDAGLVAALEQLRTQTGPIVVLSGCRCFTHNKTVGGELNSYHVLGLAADIMVRRWTARQIYQAVRMVPAFRGVGVDDERGFVHVDVRHAPAARWCYRRGRQSAWRTAA